MGLTELEKLIKEYFPLGQREKGLEDSGVGMLRGASSTADLFERMMRLKALTIDSGVVYGAEPDDEHIDAAAGIATFSTLAGQTWRFELDDEGVWKTAHLEPVMEQRLRSLRLNLGMARGFTKDAQAHEKAVEARFQELAGGKKAKAASGGAGDAPTAGPGGALAPGDGAKAKARKKAKRKAKRKAKKRRKKKKKRKRR
jgi:hypothetical protein